MKSEQKETDLATLIGSRICHDLISPIGAISNGLELLSMSGEPSGPEFDLIADSAGNAGARIGFFRVAFGAANARPMTRSEISGILTAMTAGTRILAAWQPSEPQSRSAVRLAFLAYQCCESALPYGGTITVTNHDQWEVTAQADTINIDRPLWDDLANGKPPATPAAATVQFALLPVLAQEDGRALSVNLTQNSVTIRF